MTDYLKRLIGLSPWSRMHRKAFLLGFEEGMRVGELNNIQSAVAFITDYERRIETGEGRTIN
jgi:hypothetical protein